MSKQLPYSYGLPRCRQAVKTARHWSCKVQFSSLNQLHHRHPCEGFGDGVNRKASPISHWNRVLDIGQTIGAEQDDFSVPDDRNLEPRYPAFLHLIPQKGFHTVGVGFILSLRLTLRLETDHHRYYQ